VVGHTLILSNKKMSVRESVQKRVMLIDIKCWRWNDVAFLSFNQCTVIGLLLLVWSMTLDMGPTSCTKYIMPC